MARKSITRESKAFDLYRQMFKEAKSSGKIKRIHRSRMSKETFGEALANMDIFLGIEGTSRKATRKEISEIIKYTSGKISLAALRQMAADYGMKYGEFLKRWNALSDSQRNQMVHEYFVKHSAKEEDVYEGAEAFDEDDEFDIELASKERKGDSSNAGFWD